MTKRLQSIILCGGPGARLWPESSLANPKPFLDLIGGRSLFQRTFTRMAKICEAQPPVIVTGSAYVVKVRAQLRGLGAQAFIIAEPEGRDSGPALLAAAEWIARRDPDALAVAVASDHHIPDEAAFAAGVEAARAAAAAGEIVTFGVRPDVPAVAYGYIRPGRALPGAGGVLRVVRFIEKPDLDRAEALVAEGCLWNSGNFMFRVAALVAQAGDLAPDLLAPVRAALDTGIEEDGVLRLGPAFASAPRVSIDVAVMEKTDRAAVLPIDYAWSDLGAWDAIWRASPRDEEGNAVAGSAVVQGARDCLVRAGPGVRVVAIGLRDIAVVATGGDVLVSGRDAGSALKPALAALDELGGATAAGRQGRGEDVGEESLQGAAVRLRRWLWETALPLWWCLGADHARGGFHESLERDLRPSDAPRRARVQARQVHVYALAGLAGWPGPWRAAVAHGLDYLRLRYRRPDGLYRAAVGLDGAPIDQTAILYDQAFVLLALASAAAAEPARAAVFEAEGLALAESVRRAFAHKAGGFLAVEREGGFLANPLMHLFEAALAWEQVSDHPAWARLSRELAGLFLDRLSDARNGGGRIPEVFDAAWRPVSGEDGGGLEPGHHYEWAWLIERWAARHQDPLGHRAARALYASAERGVDPVSGLVYDLLADDFSVRQVTSRLWPQTERVRAALLLAPAVGEASALVSARSALMAMEAYLDQATPGLWRDCPSVTGPDAQAPARASSFYHIVGAILALDPGAG